MDLQKVFSYIDAHFDEMLDEMTGLCCLRSVKGDTEGLEATRAAIVKKLHALGLSPVRHPVEGGNDVITATTPGGGNAPTLLIYNHYDVVHEGVRELWKFDPFVPAVEDGVLYGRGVSDNKGALIGRLQALEAIRAVGEELPVKLKFFYEGDEESGSPSLKKFVKDSPETFRELTRADCALWEGGKKDDDGHIRATHGARGAMKFALSVKSIDHDCHSRNSTMYPNAAWRLVWALSLLKDKDERVLIPGFYDDILPVTEADRRALEQLPLNEAALLADQKLDHFLKNATGLELKERLYMQSTLCVSGLDAGEMYKHPRSIVPHTARAELSIHMVAAQDPYKIEASLKRYLADNGFDDIVVASSAASCYPAVRSRVDTPFTQALVRAAEKVYEQPLVVEPTMLGAGPQFYFRDCWPDLVMVGVGPANEHSGNHGPNENIRVQDYRQFLKMMAAVYAETGTIRN